MNWKKSSKIGLLTLGAAGVLAGAAEIMRLEYKVRELEQTLSSHFLPDKQKFMKVELYSFGPQHQGISILRFNPPEEKNDGRNVYVDQNGWRYSSQRP